MYFYRHSLNLEHIDHCGWLRQLILIAASVALTMSFNVHIDKVCNYLRKNYNYICAHILNLSGPSKAHSKFFISYAVILMFVNCFCLLFFSLSLPVIFIFSSIDCCTRTYPYRQTQIETLYDFYLYADHYINSWYFWF